ncbi:hypothetical protein P7D85_12740 [Enterococcus hulanensis]|uniref:Uncharacterized protein n=1 Tax=Enterococcus hulanensis TaxID=2559929 RepID=A0ABU3F2A3_9ENTE|nr:hypothetical protein [Enterococcus hulanensis]MDT2600648.1 hypothetical protein [Enterococcus hulanensis]MDT2610171.1 hypothetical protein [Enterococcus hulanensis]MDT2617421.1 hypothetical protein [Enterococcus hulanensis]MDT2628116.1 hypothetical protein [Enterococcus hulanensis]MDT2655221.1 hypothetical protein [Enterococcus hulanensis]
MIALIAFLLAGIGGLFLILIRRSKKIFSATDQLMLSLFFVLLSLFLIILSSVHLFFSL